MRNLICFVSALALRSETLVSQSGRGIDKGFEEKDTDTEFLEPRRGQMLIGCKSIGMCALLPGSVPREIVTCKRKSLWCMRSTGDYRS